MLTLILIAAAVTLLTLGIAAGSTDPLHARYSPHPKAAPSPDWRAKYRKLARYTHRVERQRDHNRRLLRVHWHPTVDYAISLASRVTGVPASQMRAVSFCESRWDPFAVNGRYGGLFQLGWYPFGLSKFDPVANALSAAMTVRHDGSWRQWECKP